MIPMIKRVIKRLLSQSMIDGLRGILDRLDMFFVNVFLSADGVAKFYYLFFNKSFNREMRSVIRARARYNKSFAGENPASYSLRRNIHRLEKGLIMRPRRECFAESYIQDTIRSLRHCNESKVLGRAEEAWAKSVLTEYFNAVNGNSEVRSARELFERYDDECVHSDCISGQGPMMYSEISPTAVSFDDLEQLCSRRHSVRWFEEKAVPKDLIDKAIELALSAPSACNRQPFKFYVFDNPERAREIGAIPFGTAGFSDNFQCLVVIVGDLSAYPFEKDRHVIYIDTALVAMQFQLALETLDLGSCIINWADIEPLEQRMSEELHLEPFQRPTMLIAVGYPDKASQVPFSAKRGAEEVIVRLD